MIFIVSTAQRCGSTWLTRLLSEMTGSRAVYVDGLVLGFGLRGQCDPMAPGRLRETLRAQPGVKVFKTHDIPSCEFDAVCDAIPEARILTMHRDFRDTVVSRYFYLRYYWPTEPALGPMPADFAEFLRAVEGAADQPSMERLAATQIVCEWAREWAAFEGPFATRNALRVSYAGMLEGTERGRISDFTGLPAPEDAGLEAEQKRETSATGREGAARFNRSGRSGEWKDWFSEEAGRHLAGLAAEECRRQHGGEGAAR